MYQNSALHQFRNSVVIYADIRIKQVPGGVIICRICDECKYAAFMCRVLLHCHIQLERR